ncbi:MAG: MinD/ParA family protein [Fimbriimonadaceae bacterium]|nr:MAG: MinD/ParA family protein [Fimbriimonadaceae bacterium]
MKTIAVTSGKGGVGKTSLTVNLGVCLAQQGAKTVIFDADLALANVEVQLGCKAEWTLQHVVAEQKRISEIVAEGPDGVGFIAGGSGVPTLMRSGPKRLGAFFEQLGELASDYGVLLFDTGAGLDAKVMAFLKQADEVLLVTTPDPSSVADAYATVKTLFRVKKNAVVRVVVNMAKDEKEGREIFEALERVTKAYVKKDLAFAGVVRRDEGVIEGGRARKPFVISKPNSPATQDLANLAATLIGEQNADERAA